jgi:hypothetical protein
MYYYISASKIYREEQTNEDIENGFSMYIKNEYINKLKSDADIKRMISNIYI